MQVVTLKGVIWEDFLRHKSGVQRDLGKWLSVTRNHQEPAMPLAHRSLDIPCQVASSQSLTPFLQTVPVYPPQQTIHKYHWTPDLCLKNPLTSPGAFLSRMNHLYLLGSVLVAALGGLLFGFDTIVIQGSTERLTAVFGLTQFWLGFTVASALIGTVVGAMISGRPSDSFGRRTVLITIAVIYFVSAIGCPKRRACRWR
jgi:hypothetical protein